MLMKMKKSAEKISFFSKVRKKKCPNKNQQNGFGHIPQLGTCSGSRSSLAKACFEFLSEIINICDGCVKVNAMIHWTLPPTTIVFMPSSSEESSACLMGCPYDKHRPVCGTDGRTYESRCELQKRICEGQPVLLKHRGRCSSSKCLTERLNAQRLSRRLSQATFIPECHEDGRYKSVQCHPPTGYCWCVNTYGKPVPGTSIKNKRPNCERNNDKRRSFRGRQEKKGCSQIDRANFNEDLVKIFLSDYNRLPTSSTPTTAKEPSLLDSRDKHAIEWKFSELDRNGDHDLDRKELHSLKRMLKKVVRPRACARTFTRACDQNQDRKISRAEWSICLGVDMNNEQTEHSDKGDMPPGRRGPFLQPPRNNQLTTLSAQVRPTDTNLDDLEEEEELKDCPTERLAALEEQKMSGNKPFVPECTPDGKYNRTQCFKPTGYCWCADPDTGKTISGQWAHNSRPDCSKDSTVNKTIKGCPNRKKDVFINDLMSYILNEYIASNSSPLRDNSLTSQENKERAVRRKFNMLDANSNQVIDKKEWKDFKNEIKKKKNLRKCGRNFLKLCDENNDKRVSLEEWSACLGQKENKQGPKRIGPNPLTKYLQD